MRSHVGMVGIACAVRAVQTHRLLYQGGQDNDVRKWHPARATPELGYMPVLGPAPLPTPPPRVDDGMLRKRTARENTCAYVGGQSDQPLYCSTDSACVSNPVRSNIGCCPDSSINCPIWTTCYESSERAKYTTNNGLSLWCGDAAYPHCLTHSYAGDVLSGYQLLGCGRTGGSDVVYYSTTGGTLLTTTRPKITDSASKADTTATSPPPQTTSPASPPTGLPIGTIVGGVVGGVAALGLITLGAFFLLRRGKQPTDGGAHATAASHPDAGAMYGGALPPPMAKQPIHQAQYGSFAPVDHRSSVANGSYYGESIGPSPSTNPPLHGPDPMYLSFAAGSPPSSQEQGTGYGPVMHHQNGPAPASHRVAELDTSRGDRELRELE